MKRNFLYVKCWPEQSKKDAALQVALLMAVPGVGVLSVNEDTIWKSGTPFFLLRIYV